MIHMYLILMLQTITQVQATRHHYAQIALTQG